MKSPGFTQSTGTTLLFPLVELCSYILIRIGWPATHEPKANQGSLWPCGAAGCQQRACRSPRRYRARRKIARLHSPTRALAAMILFLSVSASAGESGGSERTNDANGPSLLVNFRSTIRERAAARDCTEPRGNLSNPAAGSVAGSNCDCGPFMRELLMSDCAPLLRFPPQTQTTGGGFHPVRRLLTPHSSCARKGHSD